MRPIATDVARSVACVLGTRWIAQTAEPIVSRQILVDPGNHAFDGGAYCRHSANMIELSVRGGNAASCEITLTAGPLVWCNYGIWWTAETRLAWTV